MPLYKTLYSSVVAMRRSSRNTRSPTTQCQPRIGIWKAWGLWKKVLRKTPCCPSFLKQTAAKRVQVQATDAMRRTQHSGEREYTIHISFQSQKFAWWLLYWTGRHQLLFFGKLQFSHKCVQEEQSSQWSKHEIGSCEWSITHSQSNICQKLVATLKKIWWLCKLQSLHESGKQLGCIIIVLTLCQKYLEISLYLSHIAFFLLAKFGPKNGN
jgi:hypothetical protein